MPTVNLKGVTVYLDPEIHAALKNLAKAEDRSISNLLSRVAKEWVRERQAAQGETSDGQ